MSCIGCGYTCMDMYGQQCVGQIKSPTYSRVLWVGLFFHLPRDYDIIMITMKVYQLELDNLLDRRYIWDH